MVATSFRSVALALRGSGGNCLYCKTPMRLDATDRLEGYDGDFDLWKLYRCDVCGYWSIDHKGERFDMHLASSRKCYACGVMEHFEVSSIQAPTEELREYLVRQSADIASIHPRKLEILVASIFKNRGFSVELTSYSKDGGVDLFLLADSSGQPTVVQVKRNNPARKIGVSEIDAFLGAMARHGKYHGIYVTTSTYTRGASINAAAQSRRDPPVFLELWDGDRLLHALRELRPVPVDSGVRAWKLRKLMPIEYTKDGDLIPSVQVHDRSLAHIKWWTSTVSDSPQDVIDSKEASELLPTALSRRSCLRLLRKFENRNEFMNGLDCEVCYLAYDKELGVKTLRCLRGEIRVTRKGTRIHTSAGIELAPKDRWYVQERGYAKVTEINASSVVSVAPRSASAREYLSSRLLTFGGDVFEVLAGSP